MNNSNDDIEKTTNFILLSTARSGSTLLMDLLNNHPDVKCLHEPLNREILSEKHLDGASKESILEHLRSVMAEELEPVVGMKVFLEHFRDTGLSLTDLLKLMNNPKVIVLYRPNVLDTYVSLQIAYLNDKWYSTDKMNSVSIAINWEDFREYSKEWRGLWNSALAEAGSMVVGDDIVYITYDELCENKDGATNRLHRFLGVWEMDYELRHYSVKQNPVELKDKIKNFDEISHFLSTESELLTLNFDVC